MRYAGFKIRSAAYTIDGFIVIAIGYLIYYLMGGSAKADDWTDLLAQAQQQSAETGIPNVADLLTKGPSLWLMTAVSAVYNIGFVLMRWQATPGKHWRGLKVVKADGSKLDLMTAIIRHAASGLSTILLFMGFAMAGWTKQKTALHDIIANTRVIYREAA